MYHSLAHAKRIWHPTPQILAKAVLVTIARKWKQSYVLQPMDNGNVVLHSTKYYSVAERNEVEAPPLGSILWPTAPTVFLEAGLGLGTPGEAPPANHWSHLSPTTNPDSTLSPVLHIMAYIFRRRLLLYSRQGRSRNPNPGRKLLLYWNPCHTRNPRDQAGNQNSRGQTDTWNLRGNIGT